MSNSSVYKSYSELIKIKDYYERLDYLTLNSTVGEMTFGGHRYLNQKFYKSPEWIQTRNRVIFRDNGHDLAHPDYQIIGPVYIHHINPISIDDIISMRPCVFDLENLVCVSFKTHNAIHYGRDNLELPKVVARRSPNDTCPWK